MYSCGSPNSVARQLSRRNRNTNYGGSFNNGDLRGGKLIAKELHSFIIAIVSSINMERVALGTHYSFQLFVLFVCLSIALFSIISLFCQY